MAKAKEVDRVVTITVRGALNFPGLADPDAAGKPVDLVITGATVVGTDISMGANPSAGRQSGRQALQKFHVALDAESVEIADSAESDPPTVP